MFNISVNDFTVKRNMVNKELKNLHSKLSELGITQGANIRVELGRAHQEGVFELIIYAIRLSDI